MRHLLRKVILSEKIRMKITHQILVDESNQYRDLLH